MKDLAKVSPEVVGTTCSWCGLEIPEDVPVWGMAATLKPGVSLEEYQGAGVRMQLHSQDRTVMAIVAGADSDALKDGHDLMFMTCSRECGLEMRMALEIESIGENDMLESINDLDLD